jgi:hypothetical protein
MTAPSATLANSIGPRVILNKSPNPQGIGLKDSSRNSCSSPRIYQPAEYWTFVVHSCRSASTSLNPFISREGLLSSSECAPFYGFVADKPYSMANPRTATAGRSIWDIVGRGTFESAVNARTACAPETGLTKRSRRRRATLQHKPSAFRRLRLHLCL